jgi:tricorn protease
VGFFRPETGWLVENRGAVPDITVECRPEDVLSARDPQLDRAVGMCLDLLEKSDVRVPEAPAFPKK